MYDASNDISVSSLQQTIQRMTAVTKQHKI